MGSGPHSEEGIVCSSLDRTIWYHANTMLTIAEEMFLLGLDEETGKFQDRLPVHSLRNAVS